jgi:hypothetical protein
MRKSLGILAILFLVTITGCNSSPENAQTPKRITKHITTLERDLPKEDNLYDTLQFIVTPEEMDVLNTLDYDKGYNKEGTLSQDHTFESDEYRIIAPDMINKLTDGKLLGRYYIDADYNVYYFTQPLNPYHTQPKQDIAFLEKKLIEEDNLSEILSEEISSDEMRVFNELDQMRGYNSDGMINKSYEFSSKEYRNILPEYIDGLADSILSGKYYVDENFNVFYFVGPTHLKP